MRYFAGLAMHQVWCANHRSPKRLAYSLMPQANSKHRNLSSEMVNQVYADASFPRCAWSRGNKDPLRPHGFNFGHGHLIIATHFNLSPQLAEILHQVVGEGVVVVQDENHALSDYLKPVPVPVAKKLERM